MPTKAERPSEGGHWYDQFQILAFMHEHEHWGPWEDSLTGTYLMAEDEA